MVSVFTPNIQLEEPARGDDIGTWDTPVNSNMSLIDLVVGGVTNIAVAGAGIVLAAAQYQSKTIIFNSTLTASITVTFPTSFTKSYEILNNTTGSSNFTITLKTTAGTAAICAPPGECTDIISLSTGGMSYKNLGRVGSYWDHGGSSVPNWVSGCTTPPYLLCDGTAFSSATYPNLRNFLGGANTPDARGRTRYALDAGTARITGVMAAGNTILSGDGDQYLMAHNHTGVTGTDSPDHTHTYLTAQSKNGTSPAGGAFLTMWHDSGGGSATANSGGISNNHAHNFTTNNSGAGASQNLPPLYISGITMIRAG